MIAPNSQCKKGSDAAKRRNHSPTIKLAVLTVALIAACAGVMMYLQSSHKDETSKDIPKVQKTKRSSLPEPKVKQNTAPVTNVVETAKRLENGVEVISSTITTNANGITVERLVLANGKTKKKVRHPKPIFEFSSDDLIATAISVKPGAAMPPLPIDKNIDKEFAQSLLSPIRINEDDSDEVKEIKAKVMETRAYLAEEIKRGGSVYQALMDHQNEQNRIADNRLMAIQEMQKVRAEMGEDAANEFRDRVNESFRIRGIPEIGKKPTEQENLP